MNVVECPSPGSQNHFRPFLCLWWLCLVMCVPLSWKEVSFTFEPSDFSVTPLLVNCNLWASLPLLAAVSHQVRSPSLEDGEQWEGEGSIYRPLDWAFGCRVVQNSLFLIFFVIFCVSCCYWCLAPPDHILKDV